MVTMLTMLTMIYDAFAPFVLTESEQNGLDFSGRAARKIEGRAFATPRTPTSPKIPSAMWRTRTGRNYVWAAGPMSRHAALATARTLAAYLPWYFSKPAIRLR